MSPLVNGLMPAYNAGRHIAESVELVRAQTFQDWELVVVDDGSADDTGEVARRLAAADARVRAELKREELRGLYARAGIFRHAALYDEDTHARPELAGHLSMSTARAMAVGCVPVLINKGSQTEIVGHGVNGFLRDMLEELAEYTRLLAGDAGLRA